MIRKILKLKKVGSFNTITQEKNFQYGEAEQNCNIIFGFNGSGKTTLSNALSFFADNSFINEDEKKEIFEDIKQGDDSIIELELQDNSKIKYPANRPHSKRLYVFNSNFVINHVFDGTKGKLRKFSNIKGEIKNKEIEGMNEKIRKLEEEKNKIEGENKKFKENHAQITRARSKSFSKTLTDKNKRLQIQDLSNVLLPNKNIEELEYKLDLLSADYDLSKKQEDLKNDLEEITKVHFEPIDLNFANIANLLSKNITQLSKDVLEKKIQEVQNLFIDDDYDKRNVEGWFKFGKNVLEKINKRGENKHCPICSTNISASFNIVLKDYEGYFDESYEIFIKELKQEIEDICGIISSVEQYETNAAKLKRIKIKYEKLLKDFSIDEYDFTDVRNDLKELKQSLEGKKDNIQDIFSKPRTIEDNITILNSTLTSLQELQNNIFKFLKSKKLVTHSIEEEIRRTYNKLIICEFNQTNPAGALEKYKNNQERISKITNTETPALKKELTEELKKIKTESKSISNFLAKMGIDHFDVDIKEAEKEENIVIKYKHSMAERNMLRNCLSDSEKTALAFAYFLSKFENEISLDTEMKTFTVIIDDPISSLDENRLYSTADLIRHNFINAKQLIVLSHNFLFLKFFNSFYRGKANCLFLSQNKILELPNELKNFETPYFYMLRNILDFLDPSNQDVTYNEVKKYLPNFIRRVLETFLSFKFSRTVNRNKGYRSPGLNEFNNNIDNTDMDEKVKKILKEKIAKINKITDVHSHGSMHYTQESFYISEHDLKELAQNTIFIIQTMDNLHKTCFQHRE